MRICATDEGRAFVDRELDLPAAWSVDPVRGAAAVGSPLTAVTNAGAGHGRDRILAEVHVPDGPAVQDAIRAAACVGRSSRTTKIGKGLLGLEYYEVCEWIPWHRYFTLAMRAAAFLDRHPCQSARISPPSENGSARWPRPASYLLARRFAPWWPPRPWPGALTPAAFALAPTPCHAVEAVRAKTFEILDGTLWPIIRVAVDRPPAPGSTGSTG